MLLFAIVSLISIAVVNCETYFYPDICMETDRLAFVTCYLNTTESPTFNILATFFDTTGEACLATKLNVRNGKAKISANVDGDTVESPVYSPFVPREVSFGNNLPMVNIIYVHNFTHLLFGSRHYFYEAARVRFQAEHLKDMEVTTDGPNILFCEDSLKIQRL